MYADDVQLYLAFDVLASRDANIHHDLGKIKHWSFQNSLTVNTNKSKSIVFGTTNKLRALSNFQLSFYNVTIEQVEEVTNLGLTFDKHLDFIPHVSEISRKCYCSFKQISSLRNILSGDIKMLLWKSLVLSHINYDDFVYGPRLILSQTNKLQKIQNICTRFVTNSSVYELMTPYIRQLDLLK